MLLHVESPRRVVRSVTLLGSTLLVTLLLGACSGLIGVNDIFFDANATAVGGEGGNGEGSASLDGSSSEGGDATVVIRCDEADTQTDPKHCGACGQDCTNGVCAAGVCTLAQDMKSPNSVVVRGGSVYVGLLGGTGAVVSCPTSGCASATVGVKDLTIGAADPYPWRLAITDTHIWASDYLSSNKGGVRRILPAGGEFLKFPPAPLERSYGIAVDKTAVYWTTVGSPGAVHWCDLPACAGGLKTAATVVNGDAELISVAADGNIVWAENSGGVLKRCASKTACTPVLLVPDFLGVVNDLTIDGTTVYWGTNLGEILSCATTGCANVTKLVLEEPKATIGAIAVSGTSLFWSSMEFLADGNNVNSAEGKIKTCTMPKCTAADIKVLATGQNDPSAMTVDANSVFWANSGKRGFSDGIGNLMKAPRVPKL